MNFFNRTIRIALLALATTGSSAWAQDLCLHLNPAQGVAGTTTLPLTTTDGTATAQLLNGATLVEVEDCKVVALGSQNGYVNLGEEAGKMASTLSDFTLHMKVYIPNTADISGAGNFLCCFATAENAGDRGSGYFFLSAKESRYAISRTNWSGETSTGSQGTLEKGSWQALTVVQSGTKLSLRINGRQVASVDDCSLTPGDLGTLPYCWLGRSCYSTDSYLKEAMIADFRLYDGVLSAAAISELEAETAQLDAVATQLELAYLTENALPERVERYTQLPTTAGDATITYTSDRPDLISPQGVVRCPEAEEGTVEAHVQATFSLDGSSLTKDFTLEIAPISGERSGYTAYLFVYFIGNSPSQEQIYYALSYDGFNYTPLNGGNPVIGADSIALKHSVRDPHILRGEDGMFYMVLTDMRSAEGWSSNDGLVLMKSPDLIHWTHTAIDFPTQWPDRFDRNTLTQVWAPQTIYDPASGRYVVYYSIGEQGQHYKIYYSYANEDFTELTEPAVLYDHGANTIDGDIVVDAEGVYHLFFKTEGEGNGIQQATAPSLFGPWTAEGRYLQQTSVAVEGSGVFPLIDAQEWVLMYDCYTSGYYQFCTSPDLYNFTWVADTRTSGAFTPRHGTVIPITAAEQRALTTQWPGTQFDIVPEFIATGIEAPQAAGESRTVSNRRYYDLNGVALPQEKATAAAGYYIEQTEYTDGQTESHIRLQSGR
ncbi:MAG: family 43 glycosylhydrolase [Bacteroidaceae bacterium]|jgi:hypothetical protein